jgi:hypothetical protein
MAVSSAKKKEDRERRQRANERHGETSIRRRQVQRPDERTAQPLVAKPLWQPPSSLAPATSLTPSLHIDRDGNSFFASLETLATDARNAVGHFIDLLTPQTILDAIDSLNVETARRYQAQKKRGLTFCNVFVQDVMHKLGVEFPETNANTAHRWLLTEGAKAGWKPVTARQAQALANKGHAVVASWKNSRGHGHIAVVRPGHPVDGVPVISQAGSKNFEEGSVSRGFGQRTPVYFANFGANAPTSTAG